MTRALFLIDEGIHDNVMPPKIQRIRVKRSQHIARVVISSSVSEVGNGLFDISEVAVRMLGRTFVR